MLGELINLLRRAGASGLDVAWDGDRLRVTGPRTAAALAREILGRKSQLAQDRTLVDVAMGRRTLLDWSHARVGRPAACALCGAPTPLRAPCGQPAHKACVERLLRVG